MASGSTVTVVHSLILPLYSARVLHVNLLTIHDEFREATSCWVASSSKWVWVVVAPLMIVHTYELASFLVALTFFMLLAAEFFYRFLNDLPYRQVSTNGSVATLSHREQWNTKHKRLSMALTFSREQDM